MDFKILVMVPILVIILITMFPMLDTVSAQLFSSLDSTTNIYYVNLIKLLVGSFGLILTLGVIIKIIRALQSPPQATVSDWS